MTDQADEVMQLKKTVAEEFDLREPEEKKNWRKRAGEEERREEERREEAKKKEQLIGAIFR